MTITGTNLAGATGVSFGGAAGTISADTGTQITVTSPPGNAGAVDITVTTPSGTSNAEQFTYVVPPPTLTGISPTSGSTNGKTLVTLTGTDLTGATSVSFGGAAGAISTDTGTQITVFSPPGDAGTVDVTVTTPSGTSGAEQFTYVVPPPALTGISPTSGSTGGGTTVTITGTNLAGATSVSFGGAAGTITADTGTQITVTSPAGSAGTVNVTVTTPSGTSNAEQFTYIVIIQ